MAAETSRTGAPLIRPLVFDFADDTQALDEAHSYMFGRSIHVAPVVAPGVEEWPVYLPESEGGWFDLWTGQHRVGGKSHIVAAPLERIPLHGRAGTILPLGPVLQSTTEATGEVVDLYVFPGQDAALELYEDDGLSNGYEGGEFAIIPIRWDDRLGEIQFGKRQGRFASCGPNAGSWCISSAPAWRRWSGAPVP